MLELLVDRMIHLSESCLQRTSPEAAKAPGMYEPPAMDSGDGSVYAVMTLAQRTRTLHDELTDSILSCVRTLQYVAVCDLMCIF